MIKKILLPTDFSAHAQRALEFASAIALRAHASLTLLHAYHIPYRASETVLASNKIYEILKEDSEKNLKHLQQALQEKHPELNVDIISHRGDVRSYVSRHSGVFDLIVMGTKGSSDFENMVFGSTTTAVLNAADCPVLAVPASSTPSHIKRIAYASNYEKYDIDVIERIKAFALLLGAEIHVVHFVEPGLDDFEEMIRYRGFQQVVKEHIAYPHLHVHKIIAEDFEEGLQSFTQQQQIDMLAMLTHKRGFLEKIFLPSLTKEVILNISMPVLAFRQH